MANEQPPKANGEPPVRTYAIIAGILVLAAVLYGVFEGRRVQGAAEGSPKSHPTAVSSTVP